MDDIDKKIVATLNQLVTDISDDNDNFKELDINFRAIREGEQLCEISFIRLHKE